MKLHKDILENVEPCHVVHSPQLVDLTLQQIVDAGGIQNPYQLFVLGHITQFFKNGLRSVDLHLENPISFNTDATSVEVKQAMQSLTNEETVQLATYLLDCIKAGECMLHNSSEDIVSWMNFVLMKQR